MAGSTNHNVISTSTAASLKKGILGRVWLLAASACRHATPVAHHKGPVRFPYNPYFSAYFFS